MREQVRDLMGKHDKDESGHLDKQELVTLVTELNLGVKISDSIFEKIWKSADQNDDGTVEMEELAPALSRWDQGDFEDKTAAAKGGSKYVVGVGSGVKMEKMYFASDTRRHGLRGGTCCVVS
jgi:hypothetical protein